MYAEIKSNNKILINRLDDSERILLSDIFAKAQQENSVLTMQPLTDETGEFGGVFVEVTEKQKEVTE